jgi:hypothetical protein
MENELKNIDMKNKQKLLRIILSPFIFLWGCFMLFAGTLFPLPLLVCFSFGGFISIPFVWLLKQSGSDIDYMDPFFNECGDSDWGEEDKAYIVAGNHFLGITIYFWGAFVVTYDYIKTGEVFTGN